MKARLPIQRDRGIIKLGYFKKHPRRTGIAGRLLRRSQQPARTASSPLVLHDTQRQHLALARHAADQNQPGRIGVNMDKHSGNAGRGEKPFKIGFAPRISKGSGMDGGEQA